MPFGIGQVLLSPAAAIYLAAIKGFTSVMDAKTASLTGDEAPDQLQRLRFRVWGRSEDSMLEAGGVWAADDAMRGLAALDALRPIMGGRSAATMAFSTTRSVARLLEKAVYDVQVMRTARRPHSARA